MDAEELKERIVVSLEHQGFSLADGRILPPPDLDKDRLRSLHALAVQHRIERAKESLCPYESRFLKRLASGPEVIPEQITPRLVEVKRGSQDELLFRYAKLHWSIPVSAGYGRRLRFLVIDESNDRLIGIFGLGDPVFSLRARDQWVGWNKETRRHQLHHVMDAFVLGAVPPYSSLICGKLVAMLVASDEVREAFKRKYHDHQSLVRGRSLDGQLALITTNSALGRSSLYNRIKYHDRMLYKNVGFTQGSGEFHFSNGLYGAIFEYTTENCQPTAKQDLWGKGFRNRREVIRKCLASLELPSEWLYHGVRREIMVIPLAENTREFLRGEDTEVCSFNQPADDLFAWFRERWLLPRAKRDQRYLEFTPNSYSLWNGKE
jgi:hypothetical protein